MGLDNGHLFRHRWFHHVSLFRSWANILVDMNPWRTSAEYALCTEEEAPAQQQGKVVVVDPQS